MIREIIGSYFTTNCITIVNHILTREIYYMHDKTRVCNTPKFIPKNKGDLNIKDKEDLQFYR